MTATRTCVLSSRSAPPNIQKRSRPTVRRQGTKSNNPTFKRNEVFDVLSSSAGKFHQALQLYSSYNKGGAGNRAFCVPSINYACRIMPVASNQSIRATGSKLKQQQHNQCKINLKNAKLAKIGPDLFASAPDVFFGGNSPGFHCNSFLQLFDRSWSSSACARVKQWFRFLRHGTAPSRRRDKKSKRRSGALDVQAVLPRSQMQIKEIEGCRTSIFTILYIWVVIPVVIGLLHLPVEVVLGHVGRPHHKESSCVHWISKIVQFKRVLVCGPACIVHISLYGDQHLQCSALLLSSKANMQRCGLSGGWLPSIVST